MTNAEGNTVKVTTSAGLDRDQDRESRRQGHPPGRNRHRHGRRGRERSDQRRIDPRRRCEAAAASARCSAAAAAAGSGGGVGGGPERRLSAAANPRCSAKVASESNPLRHHRLSCGPAIADRRAVRPTARSSKRSFMSHIDSNRRRPAATAVVATGPPARLPRPGGLRRHPRAPHVHERQRLRHDARGRRTGTGGHRAPGAARVQRRCANACRRTASRCRNAPPASGGVPEVRAVQADFSAARRRRWATAAERCDPRAVAEPRSRSAAAAASRPVPTRRSDA